MDWYFGSGIDDFVVPKDQEVSDRLPSPESWSKWGISAPESFEFPNKCFVNDAYLTRADFNGEMLCDEVEMESSTIDKDQSSGSSVGGGVMEESFCQTTLSHDQPDYQLDGLVAIEQMDEIFLSSLLEDLPGTENFHKSFYFSPESQSGMGPADNRLTDIILDSQSISSDAHGMGSSKYLKTHAFSPSVGCAKGEVAASQFIPRNLEQKEWPVVKAPLVKILVPSEDDGTNGHMDEETSVEEYVLQELEMVMAQLTNKTRICFRDALYRLANNSRQHMVSQKQNGDLSMENPPLADEDEKRSVGEKTMELETNSIDRAIANLMFNKMDLNVRDFPVSTSVSSNQEIFSETRPPNYSSKQPQIHGLPHYPIFRDDAEVPIFDQGYPQTRANPDKHISRNPAEQTMQQV